MRRFRPDPIGDDAILKILEAATKAPSGGNFQPWHFVVVREKEVKLAIKEPMLRTWRAMMESPYGKRIPPASRPVYEEATKMIEEAEKVPVIIAACIDLKKVSVTEESKYASIYPAVQNMLLAAHALGIGTCLTTHGAAATRGEAEVKRILGIPDHVKIAATIFMGYPERKMGPPKRRPVKELVHYERW